MQKVTARGILINVHLTNIVLKGKALYLMGSSMSWSGAVGLSYETEVLSANVLFQSSSGCHKEAGVDILKFHIAIVIFIFL